MTTKQEIKEWGYNHAQGIPENNYDRPFEHCIEQGFNWENDQELIQGTAFNEFYEAESNSRQFSPFEFTAKDLNDMRDDKPYDVWEVFEEGIDKYYREWWKENGKERWEHIQTRLAEEVKADG